MKEDIYLLATRRYQHETILFIALFRSNQKKELNKNKSLDAKQSIRPATNIKRLHEYCRARINNYNYAPAHTLITSTLRVYQQYKAQIHTYQNVDDKIHRNASVCLTGSCLNRNLSFMGQLQQATLADQGCGRKNKKNAEKKQPCKRKDDCFIPAHKIQAKTLGEKRKKVSQNPKGLYRRKWLAKALYAASITPLLNRNNSHFLSTTVLQYCKEIPQDHI